MGKSKTFKMTLLELILRHHDFKYVFRVVRVTDCIIDRFHSVSFRLPYLRLDPASRLGRQNGMSDK